MGLCWYSILYLSNAENILERSDCDCYYIAHIYSDICEGQGAFFQVQNEVWLNRRPASDWQISILHETHQAHILMQELSQLWNTDSWLKQNSLVSELQPKQKKSTGPQ